MPLHFLTRRTYNATEHTFGTNRAGLTRYVRIGQPTSVIKPDAFRSAQDWASEVVAEANGGPILCFVHGFNMVQLEVLERLQNIQSRLDAAQFPGAVIGFDWPSKGEGLLYGTDQSTARWVAPYLVTEGLALFMNLNPRPKLHVLAHSMGAEVTLRGFSAVGDAGTVPWGVDEVAFVAADTKARYLSKGTGFAKVMRDRSARLTNYYSNQDQVLALSNNVPGNGNRLGFYGMSELKEAEHVDVYCGARYANTIPKPPPPPVGPNRHSHTWFFDDAPGFIADLKSTLSGTSSDQMGATRGFVPGTTDQGLK